MNKKVWAEAELIDENYTDNSSLIGMGKVQWIVDKNIIHDIPTSIEIPEWTVDLIEDERFDGHNLFGLLSNLISRKKFDELSAEEGTKLQKDFALAVVTNNYTVKKDPLYEVKIPDTSVYVSFYLRKSEDKIRIAEISNEFINSLDRSSEFWNDQYLLTEEEIKKDFEWAWRFARQVEEYK